LRGALGGEGGQRWAVHITAPHYEEAAKWYGLAAAQGDADAQYSLGILYDNGTGVAQDDTEAAKWFRLAADQGYAKAQNNLGALYARGRACRGIISRPICGSPYRRRRAIAAAALMTAAQIAEAKTLVREWKPKTRQ
jgi:TPR repeat protein